MSVIHINETNFQDQVLQSQKPVLVDFSAAWCGPCRMMAPILEEIAQQRPDVMVCKIDIDESPNLASAYRVVSIPTLMVVKNGQVVSQAVGARPKEMVLGML